MGVASNRFRNTRLKYEMSEKPVAAAMSLTLRHRLFGSRSKPVGRQQALLEHEAGERLTGQFEQMLHVTGADAVSGGNQRKSQVGAAEPLQYIGFDGLQARRAEAAMAGQVGSVALRTETKPDQVKRVLRDRVIGGGAELRAEPVRRLDVVEEELRQVAGVNEARNLVVDVLATVGENFV